MKLIDRYIIREFSIPFFYSIFAFALLYLVYDITVHLDEFIKEEMPIVSVIKYYSSAFPILFVNVTPAAVLISMLYTLGTLNRHNELSAMRSSGISTYRIIAPLIMVGIVLCVLVFYINNRFVPKAFMQTSSIRETELEEGNAAQSEMLENFSFYNPHELRDWFVRLYDKENNVLHNVSIREFKVLDGKEILTHRMMAKKGIWVDNQWVFFNVTIQNYDRLGQIQPGVREKLDKKITDFKESPSSFKSSLLMPNMMSYKELKKHIRLHHPDSNIYYEELIELHNKLAFPITSLIAVLISIPFGFRVSKGGFVKGIGLSIVLFLLYYGFSVISISYGKEMIIPPVLAVWLPPVVFGTVSISMITKIR